MAVKTRVTARKSEGVKCVEVGAGAGIVIDPSTVERAGQSKHGSYKIIKPSSEEFALMWNSMPNADRLHDVKCPLKNKKPGYDFENLSGQPSRRKKLKEVG
ncbi:hypothetical protein SAMN04488500_106104 [Sporomusa malonica]|uniref:Uncharacterized protein n=2 Tax=Sporomusa malonica TaxID=112901 RepID=A0A1W2ATB1_9FIRM|nr:hypothetical protein SAMN04488500_106104 [Sporomusa malonica]